MAKRAVQREAASRRAVGKARTDACDGPGLEGRTVVTAAPHVHGGLGTRLGDRGGVQRGGERGGHLGLDEGEVASGERLDDPRRSAFAAVEVHGQLAEDGDVFGGDDADRRSAHRDDRSGTDPVPGRARCTNDDGALVEPCRGGGRRKRKGRERERRERRCETGTLDHWMSPTAGAAWAGSPWDIGSRPHPGQRLQRDVLIGTAHDKGAVTRPTP